MKKGLKRFICVVSVMLMLIPLVACGSGSGSGSGSKDVGADNKFPDFKAEDLSGKQYSEKVFAESDATVVNFWFTGCQACIAEMPDLEKMSAKLAKDNVKFIGICTDAGEAGIDKEAGKILKASNVTFPNLKLKEGEKMTEFVNSINAFPTTVVVDKNGKIVGDPIVGAINGDREKVLYDRIEQAKSMNK